MILWILLFPNFITIENTVFLDLAKAVGNVQYYNMLLERLDSIYKLKKWNEEETFLELYK